jgi:CBS domain-containing protein
MTRRWNMMVEDAMTEDVAICFAADSVRDAALLMDRENRGSLFVLAEDGSGRIEGILTDRDVCLSAARGEEGTDDLCVRALMSADPHVCHPRDDLRDVLGIIEASGRRRLPVIDGGGHILGAITLTDIARVVTQFSGTEISPYEVCRALVACSRERREQAHLLLGERS